MGRYGAVDWAAMESVTSSQAKLLATIEPLLEGFAARASGHDREGSFPFENFEALREAGYVKAAVPRVCEMPIFPLTEKRVSSSIAWLW